MPQDQSSSIANQEEGRGGNQEVHVPVETPPSVPSTHLSESTHSESLGDPSNLRAVITPTKNTPLFRQSKISIAIDVSGSTYGAWLQSEINAVRSICSLFPISLRSAIRILPWSNIAERPIGLDDLEELDSDGGTDPSVLLHDDACRYELQNSSFWFLMTDGDILENEVRTFARNLVEYSLHGLASVIAIFGERESMPSKCNISVGLAVFAVSPHCAFLYTDIETGHTYILQTKGCFSALLPKGVSNPTLSANTLWTDLPRTSYENLARVPIPPPQSVSKDEVVLMDNSRINLSALLANPNVDPQTASRILDHEDNMKTIALTAKLKGQSEQFRKWLDNVEKINVDMSNPDKLERPHSEDNSNLLVEAMENLMTAETPKESITHMQRELREANARDMEALESMICESETSARQRTSSTTHARRVSSSSLTIAEDNIGSVDYRSPLPPRRQTSTPLLLGNKLASIPQIPGFEVLVGKKSLMNPGFSKPDFQRDFHKGQCMLCASTEPVMALLLRKPPRDGLSFTANYPPVGSLSLLRYPLAMGNYPETDIISGLLACDPCSFRVAKNGRMPSGDEIKAALPLVSYAKNRHAWLETINLATKKRFSMKDLPLVFLAILYAKLERLLEEGDSKMAIALRPALNWACSTLLQEVEVRDPVNMRNTPLSADLLRIFRNALESPDSVELLQFPIDGFIAANIALSNSVHKTKISASKRERVVFYRFLYHLTEQFIKLAAESGDMVRQAAMMLILILDESPRPQSLLTLETLRQFSVHFANRQEMMQALQSRLNWRPRKSKAKKLSISVKDLLDTPFLDAQSLRSFRRLGALFTWIEDKAAHAIAAFLHCLYCMETTASGAPERFAVIRKKAEMSEAISKPEEMSSKKVEDLINVFPPIMQIGSQ